MNIFTIKKYTAIRFLGLLCSIAYGFFVVASLQRLYLLGSGDVKSYLVFFANIDSATLMDRYSMSITNMGDIVFRLGVISLADFFNLDPIDVLSIFAFVFSSIIFFIFTANIRSTKYLIYLLPVFLIVFFTPMVTNLFASGIRSGIAFTLFMVAITFSKGNSKYILFALSCLIHLSMAPIVSLYILFHFLNKIKMKSNFIIHLFVLLLYSLFIVLAAKISYFNQTSINQSIFFNILILCLGMLVIFTNKKAVKNVYGFISIGLILIYLSGIIIDLSFIRYAGYSIILYFFFLIKKGEVGTIQVFTIGYMPIFLITSFYTITNVA